MKYLPVLLTLLALAPFVSAAPAPAAASADVEAEYTRAIEKRAADVGPCFGEVGNDLAADGRFLAGGADSGHLEQFRRECADRGGFRPERDRFAARPSLVWHG